AAMFAQKRTRLSGRDRGRLCRASAGSSTSAETSRTCREGSLLTAVTACTVIAGSEPELGEMAGVLVGESHCGIARLVEGICLPALAGAKGQVARQQVVVL